MNLRYVPGLRGIKTAFAVFLCLAIAHVFGRENPFYSCIAAIVCMQPTHEQSIRLGIERTIGTFIGGVVGYVTLVVCAWLPLHVEWLFLLVLPMFLLLSVYLCNVLGQEKSTAICCIVFLSIAINHGGTVAEAVSFATNRVLDTIIGIVVAVLVNRFLYPRFAEPEDENQKDGDAPPGS